MGLCCRLAAWAYGMERVSKERDIKKKGNGFNPFPNLNGRKNFWEPRVGLEPTTFSLRMKCSTN